MTCCVLARCSIASGPPKWGIRIDCSWDRAIPSEPGVDTSNLQVYCPSRLPMRVLAWFG